MQIISGFIETMVLFLNKSVSFDRSMKGKKIICDKEEYSIFRRVEITNNIKNIPTAYFIVKFRPKRMNAKANVIFSYIPMMIFMGFKGFRSKYWAVNHKTNVCMGVYEWQTIEDAKGYAESVAMQFMTKRSAFGSVSFRVIDKEKEKIEFEIVG